MNQRIELWSIGAFGIANAVLYACLMPLWEGFDEPFHYGYIQTLDSRRAIPELGRTVLSEEVLESLRLAPASPVVKRNLPFAITFSDFFSLEKAERHKLREKLWELPPELRWKESGAMNYEAQQAPLAYMAMVPPDLIWRNHPLPARILRLRLAAAIAAALLEAWLAIGLARAIGLAEVWHGSVVLLILCAQMFYASVARVSNDWLAIPVLTAVFLAVTRFAQKPRYRTASWMGAALAAGLLTKAYFLFALPFALAAAIAAGRKALRPLLLSTGIVVIAAGPWYVRNLWLYGNLSGVIQARGGVRWRELVRAVMHVPWLSAAEVMVRSAIWTGNNSFTAFSGRTVNVVIVLLACACLAWVRSPREKLLATGCGLFGFTLLFGQAMFYEGAVTGSPWYTIAAVAPFACLICAGLSRAGRIGMWIAVALHGVLAYVIVATYWLKLIPMYGGFPDSRARVGRLWEWYRSGGWMGLEDTALAPAPFVMALASVIVVLAVALVLLRSWRLIAEPRPDALAESAASSSEV